MDREDILEANMTNIYSLIWGQCTEALQQGMLGHEYLEYKDMSFDANWILKKINVTAEGIKYERHSNPYNSFYKFIRKF